MKQTDDTAAGASGASRVPKRHPPEADRLAAFAKAVQDARVRDLCRRLSRAADEREAALLTVRVETAFSGVMRRHGMPAAYARSCGYQYSVHEAGRRLRPLGHA